MADRYWVGGDGDWEDTSHWSTTSGGAGGASVPAQNDNVYFDSGSYIGDDNGIVTVNINSEANLYNMQVDTVPTNKALFFNMYASINFYGTSFNINPTTNFAWVEDSPSTKLVKKGVAGTYSGNSGNVIAYISVDSGATLTFSFNSSRTFKTLEVGGVSATQTASLRFNSNVVAETLTVKNKGFVDIFDNKRLTLTSSTTPLDVESGAIEVRDNLGEIYLEPDSTTVDISNDSIVSATLVLNPASDGYTFVFSGEGSFYNIKKPAGNKQLTVEFDTNSDLSFEKWELEGTSGYPVTVKSTVDTVRSTITYTGTGDVETNYMTIQDMQPEPDNTWISFNSTDAGNNWQWYFDDFLKPTSNLFFGSHV